GLCRPCGHRLASPRHSRIHHRERGDCCCGAGERRQLRELSGDQSIAVQSHRDYRHRFIAVACGVTSPLQSQVMPERIVCDVCGAVPPPHAHYVVRIDIFADPEMPEINTAELEEKDFDATFAQLIEQ